MRRVDAAVKSPINFNIHFTITVHASNPHYSSRYRGTLPNPHIQLRRRGTAAIPLSDGNDGGPSEGPHSRSYVFEGYDKSPGPGRLKLTGDSVVLSSTTLLSSSAREGTVGWPGTAPPAHSERALHILI